MLCGPIGHRNGRLRQAGLNEETERKAHEIRMRAERLTGKLLKEMKISGERVPGKGGNRKSPSHDATVKTKLSDLGITRDQASKWQKLAAVPKERIGNATGAQLTYTHAMRFLYLPVLACALATSVKGDLLYSFSYDAATGPLQSFAFSFTAPDFAVNGESPGFTPFTLTDGTNSWTMVSDLIEVGGTGVGCFAFGTASAQLTTIFGPCSFAVGGDGVGAFVLVTDGGLPSAVGTYASSDFTGILNTAVGSTKFFGPIGGSTDDTGSMSLTISPTSVPEPSTIALLALCFLASSKWLQAKRTPRYPRVALQGSMPCCGPRAARRRIMPRKPGPHNS